MMPRWTLALVAALVGIALVPTLGAYLKLGARTSDGNVVGILWTNQPIRYFVTNRDINGVSATQLQTTAARSFDTWGGPANVTLSAQFGGLTNTDPVDGDSVTVIGFQARPELDFTLGSTTLTTDEITGELLEADIFLNAAFAWSVAAGGEANKFDVQSVLTHELGHLLGLGHSALGETQVVGNGRSVLGKRAVMFPIAYQPGSIQDRTLDADDVSGITDVYGTSVAHQELGGIVGRVTLNGAGVFGAHVTAFCPATGELVGGFTLTAQGEFVIAALKPGQYIVRVEPLDDADSQSFFNDTPININFQVAYFGKVVTVPAGGAGATIEIKVRSK